MRGERDEQIYKMILLVSAMKREQGDVGESDGGCQGLTKR